MGFVIIQGYGMTETTSLISINHHLRTGTGNIGKLMPGMEIKLDEGGEILVRGENIAASYWQGDELKPTIDAAANKDGWFHTGDLGEMDGEGKLYFRGRKKDVIVTPEGMKIYPEDLEAALRRQPEVRECVVVGVARGGNAEACAVLILHPPSRDAGSAIQRANQSLAGFQQIRRWLVWPDDDFPRTPTQKPRTQLIQEYVQAKIGEAGGANAVMAAQPGTLANLIGRVTGRAHAHLDPGASLATDLNLSSIDRVELLSAIEDRYQMDMNEKDFGAATTVGDLEKMLRQPAVSESKYRYPRWAQRWPITWIRLTVYYLLSWPATLLLGYPCLLYTSPSPRDLSTSRMPSSA